MHMVRRTHQSIMETRIALIKIMADKKSLIEVMIVCCTDAYMRHSASMRQYNLIRYIGHL